MVERRKGSGEENLSITYMISCVKNGHVITKDIKADDSTTAFEPFKNQRCNRCDSPLQVITMPGLPPDLPEPRPKTG